MLRQDFSQLLPRTGHISRDRTLIQQEGLKHAFYKKLKLFKNKILNFDK